MPALLNSLEWDQSMQCRCFKTILQNAKEMNETSKLTFKSMLEASNLIKFKCGNQIHVPIIANGLLDDKFIGCVLIMYSNMVRFKMASDVFVLLLCKIFSLRHP